MYVLGKRICCSVMVACEEFASLHRVASFACAFPCRPRCYTMLPGDAARKFSQVFYHALITHEKTVKDAFEIAVSTVNPLAPTAAATFLLLPTGERGGVKRLRFVFHARTTFSFLRQQYAGNLCPLPVLIVMSTHISGEM